MKKKWFLLLTLVLALSIFMLGCGETEEPEPTDPSAETEEPGETDAPDETEEPDETDAPAGGVFKIGALLPMTGPEAYYGNDMFQSYQLAVDEINEAGGVLGYTFEIFNEDDACDAAQAATAGSKIVSADPDVVVGGYCSGATIPALQQFYDANLNCLISAANSTNITDLALNQTFMLNSPGTHGVQTLTNLAKSLGVVKIATIHQGDDYTKNLSDIVHREMPDDGFEVVGEEVMEKGAADVSAIVTAIRNSGAELVYWCGYFADGSNVIKQLRQGGYEGVIVCGDGSASTELITGSGEAGEGVYVTAPPFVELIEGGEDYIAQYQAKFNMPPGSYSTLCYDTIYVIKQAMEDAGSIEFEDLRVAIENIDFPGMSGQIKFAPNHELALSNFMIVQIQDGAFVRVDLE